MISIYPVRKDITSPFQDEFSIQYLKEKGIKFTNNVFEADIILSVSSTLQTFKWLRRLLPWKKFLVWTNEPRYEKQFENFKNSNTSVMNVYSGDVFFNNLHFLGSYHYNFAVDLGINLAKPPGRPLTAADIEAKKKFCVAVFAYRSPETSSLFHNNEDIDLFTKRQELAAYFQQNTKTDIIGSNWPSNYSIKESSGYESSKDEWWDRKLEILQDYKFNICFENTTYPYYCTEKIWHAIAAGCLPIYYGKGTTIYETFPRNSFIDASEFETSESLLQYMQNLNVEEHLHRYNVCLSVMHKSCAERINNQSSKTEIYERFVDRVRQFKISLN